MKFLQWKTVPIYLVSILVPFALENSSEVLQWFSPACDSGQHGVSAKVSALYYRLLEKLSPFEMRPNHVRIITLTSAVEGDWINNPCDSRKFTGALLAAIGSVHPAAIVVDWSNAPGSCRDNEINDAFKRRVQDVSRDVPVLFGRSTLSRDAVLQSDASLAERIPESALGPDRFIEMNDLLDGSGVGFGLERLNCDVRKIPLGWYVYPDVTAAKRNQPTLSKTLSVLAVSASNNASALEAGSLKGLLKDNVHPFSHFFANFDSVHAVDLLCEHRPDRLTPAGTCSTGEKQLKQLRNLRAKIVLIADVGGEQDYHESPAGKVAGVELHANYIESLISGHYWKPVHFLWQLLASLIWFGVIEIVFEKYCKQPWKAIGYVVGATFLFGFIFYYIVVMLLGYYFVLLTPSLILISIRAWQLIIEHRKEIPHVS